MKTPVLGRAVFSAGAAVLLAVLVLTALTLVPPAAVDVTPVIEKAMDLYETRPADWGGVTDARGPLALNSALLQSAFRTEPPYALSLLLQESSGGVPVAPGTWVTIVVRDPLVVEAPAPTWQTLPPRDGLRGYRAIVERPLLPNTPGEAIGESLRLRAPRPGRYRLSYLIAGETRRGQPFQIWRLFWIDLR